MWRVNSWATWAELSSYWTWERFRAVNSNQLKSHYTLILFVYIVKIRGSRLLENENKKPEKLKKAKSSLSWNYAEKYLFTFIVLFELLKDMTLWYFNLTQCAGTKSFGIFYLSYKYMHNFFFTSKIENKSKVSR